MSMAQIFQDAHQRLKPRTPAPQIQVEFFPFAGLNHTARLNDGKLHVRISDIFTDAPVEIVGSLALILMAKLYRKTVDASFHTTYRAYILRSDIQERARAARTARGRPPRHTHARGRYVDLDAAYDRVSIEYFNRQLNRPALSWSSKRSRYILGRYDSLHHTIFISRIFDSADVPDYVLDYIMFHEMLHMKHQSRVRDARCIVHTSEFRDEERQYRHYRSAKIWLKSL